MARRNLHYLYAYLGDKLASTAFACGGRALPPYFSTYFFFFFSDLNKSLNTSLCHRSGERGGSIKRPFYGPFVHLSSQPKAPGNCGNALLPWPERLLIGSRQRRQIIDTTIKLHNNQNNTRFTTNQRPVK